MAKSAAELRKEAADLRAQGNEEDAQFYERLAAKLEANQPVGLGFQPTTGVSTQPSAERKTSVLPAVGKPTGMPAAPAVKGVATPAKTAGPALSKTRSAISVSPAIKEVEPPLPAPGPAKFTSAPLPVPAAPYNRMLFKDMEVTPSGYSDLREQSAKQYEILKNLYEITRVKYLKQGYTADNAGKMAQEELNNVLRSTGVTPEGDVSYTGEGGIGAFIPTFRETRIEEHVVMDPQRPGEQKKIKLYRDPVTKELRAPTNAELLTESFARQVVMTPTEADALRQSRLETRRQQFKEAGGFVLDPTAQKELEKGIAATQEDTGSLTRDVLSSLQVKSGRVVETPLGAALRGTNALSAGINTILFDKLPLTYDVDAEGKPLDPDQTGFIPSQRRMGSGFDPTGYRAANGSGDFIADWSDAVATGRNLGDELYQIPILSQTAAVQTTSLGSDPKAPLGVPVTGVELPGKETPMILGMSTLPYWIGIGLEMLYPTPGEVAGAAKSLLGKGARAAAETRAGATAVGKTLTNAAKVVADPIESGKTYAVIRAAQDLEEGLPGKKPEFTAAVDRHTVRAATGQKVAEEITTPHIMSGLAAKEVNAAVDQGVKPTVTVGQMKALAGNTQSGLTILAKSSVNLTNDMDVLSIQQLQNIRNNAQGWRAAAAKPAINAILARADLTEAVKARMIAEELRTSGLVNEAMFTQAAPGQPFATNPYYALQALADGQQGESLTTLVPKLYNDMHNPSVISAKNPVVTSIYDLGQQLNTGMQSQEPARLRGPLARIAQRRLGQAIDVAVDPLELKIAGTSAGGRAVEATLENVAPDDLVFATRTLMVPRNVLTAENAKKVEQIIAGYDLKPMGSSGRYMVNAEGMRAFEQYVGAETIKRSPMLQSIMNKEGSRLTPSEFNLVVDTLQSKAWADTAGPKAAEAVYAGRQVTRAERPTVRTGLVFGEQKPRTVIGAGVEDVGIATGAASRLIGDMTPTKLKTAVSNTWKKVRGEGTTAKLSSTAQTPAVLVQTQREIENAVASIPDNFMDEVRTETLRARIDPQAPAMARYEEAYNRVLARRLAEDQLAAVAQVDEQAQQLSRDRNLSLNQAYALVDYQMRQGTDASGLGQRGFLRALNDPTLEAVEGVTPQVVRDHVSAVRTRAAWENNLSQFFGRDTYAEVIEPGIDRYIVLDRSLKNATEIPGNYRSLTTGEMRAVIEQIRADNETLTGLGLAQLEPTKGGYSDAIFATTAGWAMGMDRKKVTRQAVKQMLDTNPELRVDLSPSLYTTVPGRVEQERKLALENRRRVALSLNKMAQRSPPAQLPMSEAMRVENFSAPDSRGRSTSRGLLKPALADESPISAQLDNIANRQIANLSVPARRKLLEEYFSAMMSEKTQYVDIEKLVYDLDDPKLSLLYTEKQATTKALESIVNELYAKEAAARAAGAPGYTAFTGTDDELFRFVDDAVNETANKIRAAAAKSGMQLTEEEVATRAKAQVIGRMRAVLVKSSVDAMVAPAIDEMVANARAFGFAPDAGVGSYTDMVRAVSTLDVNEPAAMAMGQDFTDALRKLQVASTDGKLAENLEDLRKRDLLTKALRGQDTASNASAYAVALLADTLKSSRTLAAGGMLAGGLYYYLPTADEEGLGLPVPVPLPNTRYMGVNLLTAPLIMLTTVGAMGAIKTIGETSGYATQLDDVTRQLRLQGGLGLVDATTATTPEKIMFTSATGKPWTAAEFQDAVARNNLTMTRGGLEYNEQFVNELMRSAQLTANGLDASPFKQYVLRTMDPTLQGAAQYIANACDRSFRQNMFASALKAGYTETQAAELARGVMLDYGAVPSVLKTSLNRYMLFLAFRTAMTSELLESLARDPDTFLRTVNLQTRLQQGANEYFLTPDYAKERVYTNMDDMYVFDGQAGAFIYGPTNPAVTTYADMIQLGAYIANLGSESNDSILRAAEGVQEENLVPFLNAVVDAAFKAGKDPNDPGTKVPDEWVYYAMQTGPDTLWPYLQKRYNIEPIASAKLRAGSLTTTYVGDQPTAWKFRTVDDANAFRADLVKLTYLGAQRTMEDYSKLGMTYSVADYIDPKRRGLPSTVGFATGLSTPLSASTPTELVERGVKRGTKTAQKKVSEAEQQ